MYIPNFRIGDCLSLLMQRVFILVAFGGKVYAVESPLVSDGYSNAEAVLA